MWATRAVKEKVVWIAIGARQPFVGGVATDAVLTGGFGDRQAAGANDLNEAVPDLG
jgi:hypothetical protein